MSWSNYERALILLEQNKEECDFVGERSELLIDKAEKELGIKFSKMYRHFLNSFGAGNFGSQEIYGVLQDDFENSSVPDAIWYTLTERKETGLPDKFLII
ncbi:SMI1/KNR4 family protein [Bacillus salipaludis]|uniref:SMI1/KNR4 family protein n=1 Tax=Bacillus salipaludis TaxID=2547811 RepID=A0AA90R2F8_9BACI|nr:SMI1/KNR4 family protein [Bacillus salipaludis]MDQ6597965.1 SMI1/KNR4 family protein [Bacillus salipaludis]